MGRIPQQTKRAITVLAARIRHKRELMGMSQLTHAIGVSQQKVSDWERGKGLRATMIAIKFIAAPRS